MGSFANKWIDKNRSALGEKRYFHTAGSDQYQFLPDYGREKGHAWRASRRPILVESLNQAMMRLRVSKTSERAEYFIKKNRDDNFRHPCNLLLVVWQS
jgi:bisphosphoglycerate-dependent phosphoglycerate mutase